MDGLSDVSVSLEQNAEFDQAFELLLKLVDLRRADEIMPLGPAAVYTASVVLWLLVYQRLNRSAPLQTAVKHLVETASELCPDNKRIRENRLSSRTGTYSDARQRLTPEVAEWFAIEVSQSIIATAPPTLGGRRVFVIDGTTITLAPERALRVAFPPASNQFGEGVWPVALLAVAHELESGCAMLPEVGPMYGPQAVSEVELAQACLMRLPADSIILGDANFGIFSVAWGAVRNQQSFLLRMTEPRFDSLRKRATCVEQGEGWRTWSLKWIPSAADRRSNPDFPTGAAIEALLHEVVVHENLTLWLVTNLAESAALSAALYQRRGEVETDIRNIKVVLDTENIRARSEAMFRKELLTSMVAYNLVVQFRRQAAELARVPPKRLSFTGVWNTYRIFLMNKFSTDPAVWRSRFRIALHYAMRDKLPNRPGRNFERSTYKKGQKSAHFKKREKPPNPDKIQSRTPK